MTKLIIVSHTEHFGKDGKVYGWGPTIREINHLADQFDKIIHIACLHNGEPPESCLQYTAENIEFIPIPPFGGESLQAKLSVFNVFPKLIKAINTHRDKETWMQLRLPTGFGVLLLPYLFITGKTKRVWAKYAGNWGQQNAPLGYRIQRWWLKSGLLGINVTINGQWPGQKKHLLSFENPCLDEEQYQNGVKVADSKNFIGPFVFTYVGKLFQSKGIMDFLNAIENIPSKYVQKVLVVGDGEELERVTDFAKKSSLDIHVLGFKPVKEVHKILAESHFIVLPSRSEGFPKVLAEGAAYGAIPVASDVGAIPHYFRNGVNGFIWNIGHGTFLETFQKIPLNNPEKLKQISNAAQQVSHLFTFEHYAERILKLTADK